MVNRIIQRTLELFPEKNKARNIEIKLSKALHLQFLQNPISFKLSMERC
jgi:hypothetical protein